MREGKKNSVGCHKSCLWFQLVSSWSLPSCGANKKTHALKDANGGRGIWVNLMTKVLTSTETKKKLAIVGVLK